MVHECDRKEDNDDDAMHCYIARGVENIPVGCSVLNIELVKRFLSHCYKKLIFGQHMFASCAGISRFTVVRL